MKALLCLVLLLSNAQAQDPANYLKLFDGKIYSLKTKGVKDFTVELKSSRLTKELKEMQTFGKIENVSFKVYWTSEPQRLAVEVQGLPDGFFEVKEQLKASVMGMMDYLIPQTMAQRFAGYKISAGKTAKEFLVQDSTGVAPIPSYVLKFDDSDKLIEIVGNKPIGSYSVVPVYEKKSFADGKWVLTSQTITTNENGQTLKVVSSLDYGKENGISVLTEVEMALEQKSSLEGSKSLSSSETIEFTNYKINDGEGLKYFLGEPQSPPPIKK